MEVLIFDTGSNQVYLNLEVIAKTDPLDNLQGRLEDTTELKRKLGWMIRRAYARRFAEGGPDWKELAESTIASKLDAGLPPKNKRGKTFTRLKQNLIAPAASKLIASGGLRDSYVQKNHPNHVSRVEETDDGFEVVEGSKDPNAEFHQQGTQPYMIYPKNARSLRFIVAGGSMVFRSAVHHPGLPARPVRITHAEKSEMSQVVTDFLSKDGQFSEHD